MRAVLVRNTVYVIRFKKDHPNGGGMIVAVVEAVPEMADVAGADGDEAIRAWVHREGMPPEAAAHFTADYCPVVPWAALVAAGKPCV